MCKITKFLPSYAGLQLESEINALNAYAFDINAACSGFLFGMSTATSYIESGRYKPLSGASPERITSWKDSESL